jgi:hypothetical protein
MRWRRTAFPPPSPAFGVAFARARAAGAAGAAAAFFGSLAFAPLAFASAFAVFVPPFAMGPSEDATDAGEAPRAGGRRRRTGAVA